MDFPDLQKLSNDAERLVDLSTRLSSNKEPQRKGGVLTVARGLKDITAMQSVLVGTVTNSEKLEKYERFSREKLYRLQADWLRDPNILSSWWTRDPEINRYGGAVALPYGAGHLIISFSGLLEHVDEAVSLMIGHKEGIAREDYVQKIIEMSQNSVFSEMLQAYLQAA